jgi:chromosome segregation ATPase
MSFNIEDDQRFIGAQEKIAGLEKQLGDFNDKLSTTTERQRQVDGGLAALHVRVLLGEATERDVTRLEAERATIVKEVATLRTGIVETRERLQAMREASALIQSELRRDARRRAMFAYRDAVKRLTPLLKEASAVNEELVRLFDHVNLPGLPGPWQGLRNIREGSQYFHWCKDAEKFDWSEYGA